MLYCKRFQILDKGVRVIALGFKQNRLGKIERQDADDRVSVYGILVVIQRSVIFIFGYFAVIETNFLAASTPFIEIFVLYISYLRVIFDVLILALFSTVINSKFA